MQDMTIAQLNKALEDIKQYSYSTSDLIHSEEGTENEKIKIFDVLGGRFFLKVKVYSNSDGYSYVTSVKVVEGTARTVTVYDFSPDDQTTIG